MNIEIERRHQLLMRTWVVVLLSGAIGFWGLCAVYRTLALTGEWEHFLIRQSLWALLAWVLFFAVARIPFAPIFRYAKWLALAGWIALVVLPWAGISINGMCGWYDFFGITAQPSELVKGVYILILVRVLTRRDWTESTRALAAFGIMAAFLLPILRQPDFGTAAVFCAGGGGAFLCCAMRWRYLGFAGGGAAVALSGALLRYDYMRSRIWNFFDTAADPAGAGWHLRQFTIAVARGGWFGVKSDMAVWSSGFLPLAHNDSIFAAMCEMLGFFGAGLLLALYAAWFWQLFMLGVWRRDPVRRALIDSMAFMLLAQTLLHILVNLGMLPPTGVTLPLVSYGGSSFLGTMLMLAVAVSAARA